jgi:ubiquinone/menaquinone biosynthesis C-methylase UbiE
VSRQEQDDPIGSGDEVRTKRREVTGYSAYARDNEGLDWTDSIGSIMGTVEARACDPQWEHAREFLRPREGLRVIDCGAGRCWASYLLARDGCEVVAVDMNMDSVAGLMAGKKITQETKESFHIVCADLEHLPFRAAVFDRAVGSQFLHHAYSLERMTDEIGRVTRMEGVLVALNEHTIPLYTKDDTGFRERHPAVASGANEHAFHFRHYADVLSKAGFRILDAFPYPTWELYFLARRSGEQGTQARPAETGGALKRVAFGVLATLYRMKLLRGLAAWLVKSFAMTSFSFVAVKCNKPKRL